MPYDHATSEANFYTNLRPIAQLGVLIFFALCVLREKKRTMALVSHKFEN
jgi:hypothetical protein